MASHEDKIIRQHLGVKQGDSLPFKGWRHTSTRKDLLQIFHKLGFKRGAEIGVSEGRFSEAMLIEIPGLERLYSVDMWAPYNRISKDLAEKRYAKARERLSRYPNCTILRMTSLEASQQVEDGSLDFAYVDGAHDFDSVMLDMIRWGQKVRKGGIISGHDFYPFYQAGVMDAVYAYTRAHRVNDWYVTWEKEASWAFVKRW